MKRLVAAALALAALVVVLWSPGTPVSRPDAPLAPRAVRRYADPRTIPPPEPRDAALDRKTFPPENPPRRDKPLRDQSPPPDPARLPAPPPFRTAPAPGR